MTTKAAIGGRLRLARTRQVPRLRQSDVDDLVGVPHGRTVHYENGRASAPLDYLLKVSAAWSIPVGWFLGIEGDEFPSDSQKTNAAPGIGLVDLYPDLPMDAWDGTITEKIEVDAKFVKSGAFACRIVGTILSPKVVHRDIVIFWLSNKPQLGVISLAKPECAPPRLVIPAYNSVTGTMELHGPGVDQPVIGATEVIAVAVGVVRVMPGGDTLTIANFGGIHL